MSPYTPQTWTDFDVTKPVSAARMAVIENGIQAAQATAEAADKKPPSSGGVLYADSLGGNDSNDGLSWGTAKASLAAAITALPNGGVIEVMPGSDFTPSGTVTLNGHTIRNATFGQSGPSKAQTVVRHTFNGNLFQITAGSKGWGLHGLLLNSQQVGGVDQTGAAIAGASTAGSILGYGQCSNLVITGTGWERVLDLDGSANASGFRSVFFHRCEFFGATTVGENVRLNRPIHVYFTDCDMSQAPLAVQQGVKIIDAVSEDVFWSGKVLGDWSTEAAGGGVVFNGRITGTITCQSGAANNKFFGMFNGTWTNSGGSGNERTGITAAARVKKSAVQSLTSGTATALTFDQEDFDTETIHDNATNNSRLTIRTAGKYRLYASVVFATNSTGGRHMMFRRNGTTWLGGVQGAANSTGTEQTAVSASTTYDLAAGDYVELWAQQNSGGALDVSVSSSSTGIPTHFGIERIG